MSLVGWLAAPAWLAGWLLASRYVAARTDWLFDNDGDVSSDHIFGFALFALALWPLLFVTAWCQVAAEDGREARRAATREKQRIARELRDLEREL